MSDTTVPRPTAYDASASFLAGIGLTPLVDRAPGRLLLHAVAAGLAFDIGVRGGPANAVVATGAIIVVAALVTDGRITQPGARRSALAAAIPALCLAWRSSPWLVATNVLAVTGLLALAIVLARSGSLFDTTPCRLLWRTAGGLARSLLAPTALAPLLHRLARSSGHASRVVRGLLIATPLLFSVTVLLAAADPVFAELFTPDIDIATLVGHVVLAGFFATVVLFTVAAALGDSDDRYRSGSFGTVEVVTMLGLAAAVLALFVVSQLVALTDAGDRLVESAGLTPAEYARSGFFQLCWATALIVGFLALVGFVAAPTVMERRGVRALSAAVPLLALGLVVVSLRRMVLYDEVFGLTMLRLWAVGAAVWMGAVLVMIAARRLGAGGGRNWVVGGATVVALLLIVGANALDPEAFIVRHNVARAGDAGAAPLDLDYLRGLSDDAVPALIDEVGARALTPPGSHDPLGGRPSASHCDREVTGVAALNLAVARAAEHRRDACSQPG